jgi:hypothetical protein
MGNRQWKGFMPNAKTEFVVDEVGKVTVTLSSEKLAFELENGGRHDISATKSGSLVRSELSLLSDVVGDQLRLKQQQSWKEWSAERAPTTHSVEMSLRDEVEISDDEMGISF